MPAAAPHRFLLPVSPNRVVLPRHARQPEWLSAARRWRTAPLLAAIAQSPASWTIAQRSAPAAGTTDKPRPGAQWATALTAAAVLLALLVAGAWSVAHRELTAVRAELGAARTVLRDAAERNQALAAQAQHRLQGLHEEARAELDGLTQQLRTTAGLRGSQFQTELAALRRELADRIAVLAAERHTPGDAHEAARVAFARAREALLFVRTTYTLRLTETGEEREQSAFGTGFVASADGLALTARHVLYPWRFDRGVLASQALGLLEVLEDRTRISVWPADAQVTAGEDETAEARHEQAWRSDGELATVRVLHVGATEPVEELVLTPAGPAVVSRVEPGPGDLVVFQLLPARQGLPHLSLAEPGRPEPLDEVLVVGFPLSRLEDGRAVPQVTLGRVRRAGGPMLELDGALHPGNSGGPILDLQGRVLGLASAILDSPVYGIAVRAEALRAAIHAARGHTSALQRRLRALGCDPGAVDGRLGPRTQRAEQCAAAPL